MRVWYTEIWIQKFSKACETTLKAIISMHLIHMNQFLAVVYLLKSYRKSIGKPNIYSLHLELRYALLHPYILC